MNVFNTQNCEFDAATISALNTEADTRVPELMEAYGISEDAAIKAFQDEVASR